MPLLCPWMSYRYSPFAKSVSQSSGWKRVFWVGLFKSGRIFFTGVDADVAFCFSALETQPAVVASCLPAGSEVHNHRPEYVQPEEIWTNNVCHQCFFLPSALLCRAGEGAATEQCFTRRIHSVFFPWDCWAAQLLLAAGGWRGEAKTNQRVQDYLLCGKDL